MDSRLTAIALALLGLAGTASAQSRCIRPRADVRERGGEAHARVRAIELDLDGDGHDDLALATSGYCGSGGCTWELYLRRGHCARWVGTIRGQDIRGRARDRRGFLVLDSVEQGGALSWTQTRARFDGSGYRGRARDCTCTEDCTCSAWH